MSKEAIKFYRLFLWLLIVEKKSFPAFPVEIRVKEDGSYTPVCVDAQGWASSAPTEGACLFASVVKALQLAHPCERHTALSLRINASETMRSNRAFDLFPALHARRGVP